MLIAKEGKPFTDAEFVKKCVLSMAGNICPDIVHKFEEVPLSARTITRRIEDVCDNLLRSKKYDRQKYFIAIAIIINKMKLKELSPPLFFHCIIHQHALCAKIMSWDSIMKEVVSIINFIRSNGLNHRQFQSFLIEINAEYGDVLYYTAVRWLSRGRVLERFFMLRQEIYNFLKETSTSTSNFNVEIEKIINNIQQQKSH
ncbi:unnamed protein product [Macrosiphum euphorbiae]|uniref:Uncharacterized protein n=1 Tax=Macrosiphum euphorbiae TaxID=13131 RepID=A0AAV0Y2Q4_9HEMI|nr:unnamed protein product [Macrosiphum euphorbiae]